MSNHKQVIQIDKVFVVRMQARGGPAGVQLEFAPTVSALKSVGILPEDPLQTFCFVLPEILAHSVADAIERQLLQGDSSEGEAIH